MIRTIALLLISLSTSARADQFDYVLGFADFATAKADAVAAGGFNVDVQDWASDHAMPVTVTRISTGNPIAGYFVLISMDRRVPALLNHAALRVAIDRIKCNARQAGCIMRSTVGAAVLQDLMISPVYMGSDFLWGGLN